MPPRLSLRAITKRFPSTLANDAVSLDLAPGEIHALLGENGAGKSTLVKIIAGVLQPDSGTILWKGQPVALSGPAYARELGIGVVFQHFALFDSLTVAENLALGSGGAVPGLAGRIRSVAEKYGLALDPGRPVYSLSVGERQRVEIVRCLLREPRLLIMDEPTSVLTPQEVGTLFEALRRLAAEGCTILYISHKLEEIRVLCHSATILRGGRVVATVDPTRETPHSLAELMIGRDLVLPERKPGRAQPGAPRLAVDGLSVAPDRPDGIALQDVAIEVRAGEIVGIAGVAGNGQGELMAALSGEQPADRADAVRLDGTAVGRLGPAARRALGLAAVPEERLGRGAVPELSLAENALLSSYPRADLVKAGLIRLDRVRALAARIIQGFQVVAPGSAAEARSLSGGNLQKFIVGREILQEPTVLVAAQPTWGVDAGAAAAIHQALLDLAERGAAVLVLSQDLEELFRITDRIAVIFHGRLSPARRTSDTSIEQIGLLMGGRFDLVGAAEVVHAA